MKLVALKRLSAQRPVGTVFEESERRARALIAIKVAKPYEDEPERARRSYRRRDLTAEPAT